AASPNGPLRLNLDTHAFLNVIGSADTVMPTDLTATNLHQGAADPEPGKRKLFFANPWAIAFTTPIGAGNAYVVSAASDLLVKLNVAENGILSFTGDSNTTRYIDLNEPTNPPTSGLNAGKNPQGIVINSAGTFAYVANFVIWQCNAGPRKSVPLNASFSPHNRSQQRILNYSAIFDEIEDFEANFRNISGPGNLAVAINGNALNPNQGLMIGDTGDLNIA